MIGHDVKFKESHEQRLSRLDARVALLDAIKTARGPVCCSRGMDMVHNSKYDTWTCTAPHCGKTWEFKAGKAYCTG